MNKKVKKADHENEALGAFKLKRMLNWFGVNNVELVQAVDDEYAHFDFRMYIGDEWTGVVEVRSLNYTSDRIEELGNVIIDEDKLKGLKDIFCHYSDISKEHWWSKEILFIWQCLKDGVCFTINMEALLEIFGELKQAPQDWMKADHGEGQHTKKGWLIPVKYLRRLV